MKRFVLVAGVIIGLAGVAGAQQHGHTPGGHSTPDTREFVGIPEPMNSHMLANMRDHLAAVGEMQSALARGEFSLAGKVAETRLGMSSLEAHGASHVAGFMPKGMQDAGTIMHRAASRFAIVATDAGVSGDLKAPLAALSEVTQACVGCHAGYRTR
jgi:hypothetical protein